MAKLPPNAYVCPQDPFLAPSDLATFVLDDVINMLVRER
jgi:hypothetical protein